MALAPALLQWRDWSPAGWRGPRAFPIRHRYKTIRFRLSIRLRSCFSFPFRGRPRFRLPGRRIGAPHQHHIDCARYAETGEPSIIVQHSQSRHGQAEQRHYDSSDQRRNGAEVDAAIVLVEAAAAVQVVHLEVGAADYKII